MAMTHRMTALAHYLLSPLSSLVAALQRRDPSDDGLTPEQRTEYLAEFEEGIGKMPELSAERTDYMQVLASKVQPQIRHRRASA